MVIRFSSHLKKIVGSEYITITIDSKQTLQDIVEGLREIYPKLLPTPIENLTDEALIRYFSVIRDGSPLRLKDQVEDTDTLIFFPLLFGG